MQSTCTYLIIYFTLLQVAVYSGKKNTQKKQPKKKQITLPCSIVEGNLHNKQFLVYMSEKETSCIKRCGLILVLGTQFNINLEVNKLEVWMKRQKEQN